jgi:hypothetical protein
MTATRSDKPPLMGFISLFDFNQIYRKVAHSVGRQFGTDRNVSPRSANQWRGGSRGTPGGRGHDIYFASAIDVMTRMGRDIVRTAPTRTFH